jgi:hypothetical protein
MEEDEGREIDQQRVNKFKVLALASASKTGDFGIITKDVIKMIAAGDVYVLLSLAQTNTTFAQLMRSEDVWRALFSKDFPEDYLFCGGELPFYIVTNGHPLEKYVTIDPLDKCAWKRFYLWTRELYGGLRNKQATLMQFRLPDVNAQLSWMLLVMLSLISRQTMDSFPKMIWLAEQRSNVYKTVADLNLPWTWKYLSATQTSANVRDPVFSHDDGGGDAFHIPKTNLSLLNIGQTSSTIALFDEDDSKEFHQFMMKHFSQDSRFDDIHYDRLCKPYSFLFYTLANVHDTRCVTSMEFLLPQRMPSRLRFRRGIWMPYMAIFKQHIESVVLVIIAEHKQWYPLEKFPLNKLTSACDPFGRYAISRFSTAFRNYGNESFFYEGLELDGTLEKIFVRLSRAPRLGSNAKLVVTKSCIECGIQSLPLFACADCRDVDQTWCGNQCARSHVCK